MIVFFLLPDGGFVCGNTESRVTSYAYPSSPYANCAINAPKTAAIRMLEDESANLRMNQAVRKYDTRNWRLMADATTSSIAAMALREIARMVEV